MIPDNDTERVLASILTHAGAPVRYQDVVRACPEGAHAALAGFLRRREVRIYSDRVGRLYIGLVVPSRLTGTGRLCGGAP